MKISKDLKLVRRIQMGSTASSDNISLNPNNRIDESLYTYIIEIFKQTLKSKYYICFILISKTQP